MVSEGYWIVLESRFSTDIFIGFFRGVSESSRINGFVGTLILLDGDYSSSILDITSSGYFLELFLSFSFLFSSF